MSKTSPNVPKFLIPTSHLCAGIPNELKLKAYTNKQLYKNKQHTPKNKEETL